MQGFEELRARYARALPGKADELEAVWNAFSADPGAVAPRAALHQGVHRLSGSAPAYGFDSVGVAAQRVDAVVSDWLSSPEFARSTPQNLADTVRGGVAELIAALRSATLD